ncbi:MAG: DUF4199 domain-containing protein [Bacteroidota bacterium]
MRKTVLTYGIISGIIVTTMMLMSIWIMKDKEDLSGGMLIGYTTMVISLSLIFFAVKSYRDNELGGLISFGKCFLMGLYITLIAGCIYATGWEFYYRQSGEQYMQKYTEMYIKQMKESGTTEAQIAVEIKKMEDMQEWYKNPVLRFGMTIMEILPVGLVISLVCGLILKKKTVVSNI